MSIVKNFAYNSAITASSYIVNFIIFTIISRTLGVSNIGVVSYVDNIINYFVLFASLGISTVGIREIAATNGDRVKCSIVFSQLMSFLLVMVFCTTLVYLISVITIPLLSPYKPYFFVGLGKLILTPLMIEWLYAGNQDFKYISIRTIVIKMVYLVSVILFVNDKDDAILYFSLTSASVVLNFVVNIISARKYVDKRYFVWDFKAFAKPIFKLGVFLIITSLYSTFNYVYLGSVSSSTQVGYYYTAIRLYDVIMQIFRSYTAVIMPRMSELNAKSDTVSFGRLIEKSYSVLFSYSIPMVFIASIVAPFLVRIIAGSGYEPSANVMRVVMPVLIIAGINQINGVQILMPLHKDNILLLTGTLAALVGVVSNVIFDSKFGSMGAAITIFLSELTGCIGGLFYVHYKKIYKFPLVLFVKYLVSSLPYLAIYFIVKYFIEDFYILYIVTLLIFIIYFCFQQLFICKNEIALYLMKKIIRLKHIDR